MLEQQAGRESRQQLARRRQILKINVSQPELIGEKPQHAFFRSPTRPAKRRNKRLSPIRGGADLQNAAFFQNAFAEQADQ